MTTEELELLVTFHSLEVRTQLTPEEACVLARELLAARKVMETSRIISTASEKNLTSVAVLDAMNQLDKDLEAYDAATKGGQ